MQATLIPSCVAPSGGGGGGLGISEDGGNLLHQGSDGQIFLGATDVMGISEDDGNLLYAGSDGDVYINANDVVAQVDLRNKGRGLHILNAYGYVDSTGVEAADSVLDLARYAIEAACGGRLIFPAGKILIEDFTLLANDGGGETTSGAQQQCSMIWSGQGAKSQFGGESSYIGGTEIICPFAGEDYNQAKFVTQGLGSWLIEDITFHDPMAGAETPFFFDTNTTVQFKRCAFIGSGSGAGTKQDAIVFGGTLRPANPGSDDPDTDFSGWNSSVEDCYFDGIRRAVYGRSGANGIKLVNNVIDVHCGTDLANSAPIEFDGSLDLGDNGSMCSHNVITGNSIYGAGGYVYYIKLKKGAYNNVAFNAMIGSGGATPDIVAGVRLEGYVNGSNHYPSVQNSVFGNYVWNHVQISEDTDSRGLNSVFGETVSPGTVIANGLLNLPHSARIRIDSTPAVDFKITDGTTDYLSLIATRADFAGIVRSVIAKFEAGAGGPTWSAGTGTPEGAVTAPVGSIFSRSNGAAGTSLYVKESGAGNTGWVTAGAGAPPSLDTLNAVDKSNGGKENVSTNATATGVVNLDAANGNFHSITLTGDTTLTLSAVTNNKACSLTVLVTQDATGGRALVWPLSVKWPGGVAPIISSGANTVSMLTIVSIDGGTTWYGGLAGAGFA